MNKNLRSIVRTAAVFATFGTGLGQAGLLTLGAAADYNAFVFSDFTEVDAYAQGRVAVGGDFGPTRGGPFTVGSLRGSDGAGTFDLVVAGNFANLNASLGGGDIFVGGNMTWTNPTLPHNVYVNGNFSNPAGGGWVGGTVNYLGTYSSGAPLTHVQASGATPSPIDFRSAQANLQSVSASLAAQQANGTVSNSGGVYTLTGNSTTSNVFNLAGGTYNGATINITAPAGSTVVVNVAGSSDTFNGGNINLTGVTSQNVIFNFGSAGVLNVNSMTFNGTILAPFAAFTGNSGDLYGQLVAFSAAGSFELHDVLFTGTMASADTSGSSQTPEPSSWILAGTGAMLLAARRRKSARA